MTITPNSTFTAGAVLTANQQNNFPRGVMAYASSTASPNITTTETVILQTGTFTAVANRNYRITYYEPAVQVSAGAGNYVTNRIRISNASGTQLAGGQLQSSGATQTASALHIVCVTTFSAGTVFVVGTTQGNTGTTNLFRSAGSAAYLIVEDIGTA